MNKRLLATLAVVVALGWAGPAARAEEGQCKGAGCMNACPLAQAVNQRRSHGQEAMLASSKVRQEQVRVVVKNLSAL